MKELAPQNTPNALEPRKGAIIPGELAIIIEEAGKNIEGGYTVNIFDKSSVGEWVKILFKAARYFQKALCSLAVFL